MPGTYIITVLDLVTGCVATETIVVPPGADPITASAITTPETCAGLNNGSIDLTVIGGTPGFTFNWSPALGNIEDPANLSPGLYSVTITDSKGCPFSLSNI
ncbi:MAG TPA: hypothetical protein PKD56_09550, partial [Chitinophagales bacterium]|nr:hypothetical protein [Chitinophagales bacterium]